MRDGVVLDLNATPYETGVVTNVASGIARFLNGTGTQPAKARLFITLGQFIDMSPSLNSKREDWSRRLAALIEKHSLEAGYGVAELAAVGPIFEERRLEKAGLTGHPEARVKLQPAFWLVDGGCEWVGGESVRLAVALRVRQVGGPEQMFRFTNSPNETIEKELLTTLTKALSNTNVLANPPPNAEADLLAARGMEMATLSSPFRRQPRNAQPSTNWDYYKQHLERRKQLDENRKALLATYERTLLADPKNLEAKSMLGYALFIGPDATKREQGMELLREVAATKDPKRAAWAHRLLTNSAEMLRIAEGGFRPPVRPKDWDSLNQAYEENPSDLEIKCDLGAALRGLPRVHDRERGKQMLAEVAASNQSDQADRARKLLAEPDKYPAIAEVEHSPGYVSPEDVYEARLEEQLRNEDPAATARREFLQKNFERFVPVKFENDGIDSARIQYLRVKGNMFEYEGGNYCGFRFTLPSWFDGDLTWMRTLAKTKAQADFSAQRLEIEIIPRSGRMVGFEEPQDLEIEKYAELKQRFPYTHYFFCQYLPQRRLKAGQEYAIWFGFDEKDLPDIAFALTISSKRGRKEIGGLPVR